MFRCGFCGKVTKAGEKMVRFPVQHHEVQQFRADGKPLFKRVENDVTGEEGFIPVITKEIKVEKPCCEACFGKENEGE